MQHNSESFSDCNCCTIVIALPDSDVIIVALSVCWYQLLRLNLFPELVDSVLTADICIAARLFVLYELLDIADIKKVQNGATKRNNGLCKLSYNIICIYR